MKQKYTKFTWLTVCLSLLGLVSCRVEHDTPTCEQLPSKGQLAHCIKGMSLVAAKSPIQGNPIQDLKTLGVNSVTLLPYGYYQVGVPVIEENSPCTNVTCPYDGDNIRGAILEALQKARAAELSIMLKPQLWSVEEWVGELSFSTEQNWRTFEQNYTDFVMEWVQVAVDNQVEYFCIGTELQQFVAQRPSYWQDLITQIRAIYSGKLTYAANWDNYQNIPFWEGLDYVGVNAYFPLTPDIVPSVCALRKAWEPYRTALEKFAQTTQRPILFTEFGYMSVDGAAYNTWELEATVERISRNEIGQANALQALLVEFSQQVWWAGGFQWKWYADAVSTQCEADITKDYTPQGKKAEEVLRWLYQ